MRIVRTGLALVLLAGIVFVFSSRGYADETSKAVLRVLIKKGMVSQKEVEQAKMELPEKDTGRQKGLEERVAHLEEQAKKGIGNVKLSGISYLQYRYETENQDDFNAFEITRGYVTLKGALSDDTQWRLTTDITRKSDGDLEYRLKYAYLALLDLVPDAQIKIGQTQTSWVDWEEHVWGYRMQGTILADREGYLTSSDLGVSVVGNLGNYLQYAAMVSNGEGYHAAESDKHKVGDIRLTLIPFSGNESLRYLKVTGYFQGGNYASNQERYRAIAHIAYKSNRLTLAGEYLYAKDPYSKVSSKHPSLAGLNGDAEAKGISAYGVLRLDGKLDRLSLIARYDYLDPDDDVSDNSHYRYIYGMSYKMNDHVMFLIDNDAVNYDASAGKNDANTVLVQAQVKF